MSQLRHSPLSVRRLDAFRVALELAAAVRLLLPKVERFDKNLAAQIKGAMISVPLNIAEGMRRTGKDRAYLLTVAMGSLSEVEAALEVSVALGALEVAETKAAMELADRDCAMLYRLRQRVG